MTPFPRRPVRFLAACALAVGLPTAAQAPSIAVALVSDLSGTVRVVRGRETTPATLLADLGPGNRLEVSANGRVVVLVLGSGEEATVRGPATAQVAVTGITATPPDAISRKTGAIGNTKLRRKDLAQAAIVMRKTDQTVRLPLLTLAGTYTLDTDPVFRWTAVEGSGPHRFTLLDGEGRLLHEAQPEGAQYRLPSSLRLEAGRLYTWEIATRRANGQEFSNFGDFVVAAAPLRDEARRLKPAEGAAFAESVAYAVWLDSVELSDAARDVWARLAKERPGEGLLERMARP